MEALINYDSKSKNLSISSELESEIPHLKLEIDQLNTLTHEIIANGADVPPVPTPETFNKDISKMVRKLYEGGVQAFRLGKFEESVKQFNIAIEMITRRAKFDSFQGTIQELSLLLMSRADAYLKTKEYLKAYNDADLLLGMMMNTPENFLRRGVANYFLGNYEAARADYQRGLSFEEDHDRLNAELTICLDKILEENGDYL